MPVIKIHYPPPSFPSGGGQLTAKPSPLLGATGLLHSGELTHLLTTLLEGGGELCSALGAAAWPPAAEGAEPAEGLPDADPLAAWPGGPPEAGAPLPPGKV